MLFHVSWTRGSAVCGDRAAVGDRGYRKSHRVKHRDTRLVSSTFEFCRQPRPHNLKRETFFDQSFPERKHVGIVVLT